MVTQRATGRGAGCLLALVGWSTIATAQEPLFLNAPTPHRVRLAQGDQLPMSTQGPVRVPSPPTSISAGPQPVTRQPNLGRFGTPIPTAETLRRQTRYVAERVDADNTLDLQIARPTLLRFKQAPFRVQIGDPEIADYLDITEQEFALNGKKEGSTVLTLWFRSAEEPSEIETLSYVVRVFPDPEIGQRLESRLEALEKEVNRAFPDSAVRLTYVGNQVVVRGQAKDVEDATQILRIIGANIPNEQQQNDQLPFDPNATSSPLALRSPETLLLGGEGLVDAVETAGGVASFLRGDTPAGINPGQINRNVINLLEIAGVHQVMLKVTVAEINRSAARAIGADLALGAGNSTSFFSLLPLANLAGPVAGANLLVNQGDFQLAINALKTLNLARSLAEPNLVTLNGQPARFQVGGNFPVPVVTGATATGLQGVQFVPFGVQLSFLPLVTDHDRIRLRLQATVSTRDESLGTNVGAGAGGGGGTAVAGLQSRNFNTTVELREGQTLAIGGLVQTNFGSRSQRVPVIGDVPVLGRLFSSDGDSYDEQELVVLVTPYLVAPITSECPPALPGSDLFEPSDLEFFFGGSIVGSIAEDFRGPARTDLPKIKAFHRTEQQIIQGQPGHSMRGW